MGRKGCIVGSTRREPHPFSAMINASALRSTLQQQINAIHATGWTSDAQLLQNDLDRSGNCLAELLITRDSVEEILGWTAELQSVTA